MNPTRRSLPPWPLLVAAVTGAVLLVCYPPFRVHRFSVAGTGGPGTNAASSPTGTTGPGYSQTTAPFDAKQVATQLWEKDIPRAAEKSTDASLLLRELQKDPAGTATRLGRRASVGGTAYYFLRGRGRVTAVERSRVVVAIDDVPDATVALRTGPVFGNTVRDGTGLVDVNQAPGLAEFNALSSALNQQVEERVQPALRSVAVGSQITFAGCAEATETLPEGPWLTVIPVHAEVLP